MHWFIRGYSCRAKPGSCRGACREPKVGMARRRLTKVDGAGTSNRSRIACNPTFKSKRRHAIPAAKPLGKPPRFVVARSANPICRHIWNSICGIAAMLTNRVFVHKSLGTPVLSKSEDSHLHLKVMIWYNTFRQWRKPKSPAGGEVSADGEEKSSPLTLNTMCGDE